MHAHLFDPYIPARSLVHQLDPRIKLALAVLFILSVALAPAGAWAALVLFFATVQAAVVLAGISPVRILRRSGIALPFALAALPLLFTTPGVPWFSLPIGPWIVSPTTEGLSRFLSIACKSWISVQAALLLSAATPFPDLLLAMRAFRIPKLLVSVIGLMWRYLFVLADEAIRLMRARDARSGAGPGRGTGGSVLWRARVTGGMAGSLFIRGFDRADRVYAAMLARGYDGETRALPAPPLYPAQYGILAAGIGWLGLLILLGLLFH
jgi:cobalt/nickel transport system permease protein